MPPNATSLSTGTQGRGGSALKAGWEAELELSFELSRELSGESDGQVTRMHRHGGKGPLYVQKPFYPEGSVSHVYLLHPPGGIAGGDTLTFSAEVGRGAGVLLTTPAATKFHRTNGQSGQQRQTFTLASDASLEWLPQETIVFNESIARNETRVRLQPGAAFIGCEVVALGRPANREVLAQGSYTGRLHIERFCTKTNRYRTLFWERQRYAGGGVELSEPWGLSGLPIVGTLVATPADTDVLNALRRSDALSKQGVSATLVDTVIVIRAIGKTTSRVQDALRAAWTEVRPMVLKRPAHAPAIWRT